MVNYFFKEKAQMINIDILLVWSLKMQPLLCSGQTCFYIHRSSMIRVTQIDFEKLILIIELILLCELVGIFRE